MTEDQNELYYQTLIQFIRLIDYQANQGMITYAEATDRQQSLYNCKTVEELSARMSQMGYTP
jgi:hypothetical protein